MWQQILNDQILASIHRDIVPSQYAFHKNHNTSSLLLTLTDLMRTNTNRMCLRGLSLWVYLKLLIIPWFRSLYLYLVFTSLLLLWWKLPQDSILVPLLCTLYVNDLPQYIDSNICAFYRFADYVFFLFGSSRETPRVLGSYINLGLESYAQWPSHNF